MKVRARAILQRAIEEGIPAGWQRAHKHTESPTKESIFQQIEHYVMLNIDEVFTFDEDSGE